MDNIESKGENVEIIANTKQKQENSNQKQIAGAIILASFIIGGSILLKGNMTARAPIAQVGNNGNNSGNNIEFAPVPPVTSEDRILGDANAKVTIIEYSDFQCPFCEKFFQDAGKTIRDKYVKEGKVRFVYRDYAFLGDESTQAALAGRCAADQGKFWEYHDYLFNHQGGENRGGFADANLISFAKDIGLNEKTFTQCFNSGEHLKSIADSMSEGSKAGVRGTPKGFILKGDKVVDTIDGAEGSSSVSAKIEKALK